MIFAGLAFLGVLVSGCQGAASTVVVADAAFPAALVPLPDGGFLYAERLTGNVRTVSADDVLLAAPVMHVDVSTEGEQRGLLSLALHDDGGLFASYTNPDERLVVAELSDGPPRVIWLGPPSESRANGGHIAFAPDGTLVIGIGVLDDPHPVPARAYNGKILALDSDADASEQVPEVVSSGWNNPFAFTFTDGGALWVADNSPVDEPERMARGNDGPTASDVTEIARRHTVPAGLTDTSDKRLLLCGYLSRQMTEWKLGADSRMYPTGEVLAEDCSLDVISLTGGDIIYSNESEIRKLVPRS